MVRPAVLAIVTSAALVPTRRPASAVRAALLPFAHFHICSDDSYVAVTTLRAQPQVEPTPKPKNRCPSWEPDIPRQKVTSRRATGTAAFSRSTLSNAIGERRHLRP